MSSSLPDFSVYVSWGHLPFYACLLVGLPLIAMLGMHFWMAARSVSRRRVPEHRLLSEKRDANGIPVFFDQDTHDNDVSEQPRRKISYRPGRAVPADGSKPRRVA